MDPRWRRQVAWPGTWRVLLRRVHLLPPLSSHEPNHQSREKLQSKDGSAEPILLCVRCSSALGPRPTAHARLGLILPFSRAPLLCRRWANNDERLPHPGPASSLSPSRESYALSSSYSLFASTSSRRGALALPHAGPVLSYLVSPCPLLRDRYLESAPQQESFFDVFFPSDLPRRQSCRRLQCYLALRWALHTHAADTSDLLHRLFSRSAIHTALVLVHWRCSAASPIGTSLHYEVYSAVAASSHGLCRCHGPNGATTRYTQ